MNNEQMAKVVAKILIDAGIAPDPEDMIDLETTPLKVQITIAQSLVKNWDEDIEVDLKSRIHLEDYAMGMCAFHQFNRDCIELLDQAHRELYAERGE